MPWQCVAATKARHATLTLAQRMLSGGVDSQSKGKHMLRSAVPFSALMVVLSLGACAQDAAVPPELPEIAPDAGAPPAVVPVTSQLDLSRSMRQLWTQQAVWTRNYLMSKTHALPDTPNAASRLQDSQAQLGNVLRPFIDDVAADAVTAHLQSHANILMEVIDAQQHNDAVKLAEARSRWSTNTDQLVALLSHVNPHWELLEVQPLLENHLRLTLRQSAAYSAREWKGAIQAHDQNVATLMQLADVLTRGLVAQYPSRIVADHASTLRNQNLRLALRMGWEDQAAWTRFSLLTALAQLPDAAATASRLQRNQTQLGELFKPFYGEDAGNVLAQLLTHQVNTTLRMARLSGPAHVAAFKDARSLRNITTQQIAVLLASINPNWVAADLRAQLSLQLDQLDLETAARFNGDWAADIRAHDRLSLHALHFADVLADGIVTQFPETHPY